MKNGWERFWQMLIQAFDRMSAIQQEELIEKVAMIFTCGVTCLLIQIFSPNIPRLFRVVALPLMLLAAWWRSRKISGPAIKWLKADPRDPRELIPVGFAIIVVGILIYASVGFFTHYLR